MTNEMTLQGLYDETLMALANGKSANEAVANLTAKGVHEASARQLVDEANKVKRAAFRQAGLKAAGTGFLWVVGGIALPR